jgi:indole-3-glycerol phosphate synthase
MSSDFLAAMAAASAGRAQRAQQLRPESVLRDFLALLPPPTPLRCSEQGFDLIAELKLRSPAQGQLRAAGSEDIAQRVLGYADAGAAAVSVLTEPSRFDGSMTHLEKAARALVDVAVPAMRKDFLVHPYQVLEARAAGAGGVLVILRMLPREVLESLIDTAIEQGLFVLLEAFDEPDIALAHELVSMRPESRRLLLAGVNCRDLVSLQVVPGRLEMLAASLPSSVLRVAESGVMTAADAASVAAAGYDMALVGSALMSGDNPRRLASDMLAAGRAVLRGQRRLDLR